MPVSHDAPAAVGLQIGGRGQKLGHFRFDRLGQKRPRAIAQNLAQPVGQNPWLNQFDNVIVGHGVSLLRWRSGGSNTPTICRLPQFTPSPTFGHSSGKSGGAYAQCDGGLCFRSSEETTFPGFDKPVPKGQIICSCPITGASSGSAQGYQILGPYPCDKSFFKYCKSDVANGNTGSTIYVGAPIGTAAALTALLTGKATPPLNECGSE